MSNAENAQYTDPRLIELYDLQNTGVDDYRFYEQLIGRKALCIADIGCGTGVFAMRLAQQGHAVVGIDPAEAMLDHAGRRDRQHQVRWLHGDASRLPAELLFDVIVMTGHAFQCLLTDAAVQETLRAAHAHLRPGGRMMFESRNPATQPWQRWVPAHSHRVLSKPDGESVAIYHDTQSMQGELLRFDTHFHFQRSGWRLMSHSVLRFMLQAAIAEHLQRAGFGPLQWFGDWQGGAWSMASPEIIALAYA